MKRAFACINYIEIGFSMRLRNVFCTLIFISLMACSVFALPPAFSGLTTVGVLPGVNQTITPQGISSLSGNPVNVYCCVDGDDSCSPSAQNSVCSGSTSFASPFSSASCSFASTVTEAGTYYARCAVEDSVTGELSGTRSTPFVVSVREPCARTETMNTYCGAGGNRVAEISGSPVNYLDEETGEYKPIIPVFEKVTATEKAELRRSRLDRVSRRANYDSAVLNGSHKLLLKNQPSDADAIRVEGRDSELSFSIVELSFVGDSGTQSISVASRKRPTRQLNRDRFTYKNVFGNGSDLLFSYQPSGISQELLISSRNFFPTVQNQVGANAKLVLTHRLNVPSDLEMVVNGSTYTGGSVETSDDVVFQKDGELAFYVPTGTATDSTGASTPVTYTIRTSGGVVYFDTKLATSWLQDPARRYPVSVDPSITFPQSQAAGSDANYVVNDGFCDHNVGCNFIDANFYIGKISFAHQQALCGIISYDVSALPDNATVTDIDLNFFPINNTGDTGYTTSVIAQSMAPYLSAVSANGVSQFARCYNGFVYGSSATAWTTGQYLGNSIDLGTTGDANLTAALTTGDIFQMGLRLDSNGGGNRLFQIDAKESGRGPILTVAYTTPTNAPNAPTNLTVVPMKNFTLNSRRGGLRLAWTDNATGEVNYEVYRGTGSALTGYAQISPNLVVYADGNVTPLNSSLTYWYNVRANASGSGSGIPSLPSPIAVGKTADRNGPVMVTGLAGSNISGVGPRLNLSWNRIVDLGSPEVTSTIPTPIHYFPFDGTLDNDGNSFNDGLQATAGAAPVYVPGIYGQAASFSDRNALDANCNVVDLNLRAGVDVYPNITVEAWVKSTSFAPSSLFYADIVMAGNNTAIFPNNPASGVSLIVGRDGNVSFVMTGRNNVGFSAIFSSVLIEDGNWHHLVGTWDGSTTRLYVDGAAQTMTGAYALATYGPIDIREVMGIGGRTCRGYYGSTTSNANVDEVYIFNKALSAADIQRRYIQGATAVGFGIERSAIVDWNVSPVNGAFDTFDVNSPNYWFYDTSTGDINEVGSRVTITGASNWSATGMVSRRGYDRNQGIIFEGDFNSGSASQNLMIGLKDNTSGKDYTNGVHNFYFTTSGAIQVYEDGAGRGTVASWVNGEKYHFKIVTKNKGAYYYIDENLVYDSDYSSETDLYPYVAHYNVSAASYDNFKVTTLTTRTVLGDGNAIDMNGPPAFNFSSLTPASTSSITLGYVNPTSRADNNTTNRYVMTAYDSIGNWSDGFLNGSFEAGSGVTAYDWSAAETECIGEAACYYRTRDYNELTGYGWYAWVPGLEFGSVADVLTQAVPALNAANGKFLFRFDYHCISAANDKFTKWDVRFVSNTSSGFEMNVPGAAAHLENGTISGKILDAFTCAAGEVGRVYAYIDRNATVAPAATLIVSNLSAFGNGQEIVLDNFSLLPVTDINFMSGSKAIFVRRRDNGTVYGPFTGTSTNMTGLSVNTRYDFNYFLTDQRDNNGIYGAISTRFTQANTPGAPTLYASDANGIRMIINQNGNPDVNTHYRVFDDASSSCLCDVFGTYAFIDNFECSDQYEGCAVNTYLGWGGASGYLIGGLSPSASFDIYNTAYNGDFTHETAASTITSIFTPSGIPTNFRVDYNQDYGLGSGKGAMNLRWTDVRGESGYRVYRSVNNLTNYALIATLDANVTSYLDANISDNNTVWYYLAAVLNGSDYLVSDVNITPDRSKPAVPASFSGTASTGANAHVDLNWNRSDDNSSYSTFMDANLIRYYRFEELSGTAAYNSAEHGSNGGTEQHTTRVPGVLGLGRDFNGNAFVVAGQTGLPTGTNARTVSAWVRLASIPSVDRTIFAYGANAANQQFYIGVGPGLSAGQAQIYCGTNGEELADDEFEFTSYLNKWVNITCSYSSLTGGKLSFNGNHLASGSFSSMNTVLGGVSYIGRRFGADQNFIGQIDEVMVWNRVLDDSQVAGLYHVGTRRYAVERYDPARLSFAPLNGFYEKFNTLADWNNSNDWTATNGIAYGNSGNGTLTYKHRSDFNNFLLEYRTVRSFAGAARFRYVNASNYYQVYHNGEEGCWYVHRVAAGSMSIKGSFACSDEATLSDRNVVVKVLAQGVNFKVLLNDRMVVDFNDSNIASGSIQFTDAGNGAVYDGIDYARLTILTDANGWSDSNARDTNAPSIPGSVSVDNGTTSTADVNWTASTDYGVDYNYTITAYDSFLNASNYAVDGGFEHGLQNWPTAVGTATGTSLNASTDANTLVGRSSFKLAATGSTLGRLQNLGASLAGKTVLLSGWIRGNLSTGNVKMDLYQNSVLSTLMIATTATSDWNYFSLVVRVPAGANNLDLRVFADGSPVGWAYIDDVRVVDVNETRVVSGLSNYFVQDLNTSTVYGPYTTNTARITGLSAGQHCFKVKSRDVADNNSAYSGLDCTTVAGSSITLSSSTHPTENTWYNTASVTMSTSGTIDHIRWLRDKNITQTAAQIAAQGTHDADGSFSFTVTDSNTWFVHAVSLNDLNTAIATDDFNVFIDLNAPVANSISVSSWSGGVTGYTNDVDPPLTISASDVGGSSLQYMYFSCNGSTFSSAVAYATSYSSFNINTGAGCTDADGNKSVYVKFTDTAGNTSSTIQTVYFTLDRVAPTSNSLTIDSNAWTGGVTDFSNDDTPKMNVASTGAYRMRLACNSLDLSSMIYFTYATTLNANPGDADFNTTWGSHGCSVGDGSKTIYIQFRDEAGNQSSAVGDSFTLDRVAPVMSLSTPANAFRYSSPDPNLVATATEATSGLQICWARIGTASPPSTPSQTVYGEIAVTTCTFSGYSELSEGTYYWDVNAMDKAGNWSTFATARSIVRDNTAPTVPSAFTIENDSTAPYWDNVDNSITNLTFSALESGETCHWGTSNIAYHLLTNNCTVSGTDVNCAFGTIGQTNIGTQYVMRTHACIDDVNNAYTTQDINFGVDWNAPITGDNSSTTIVAPPYTVTLTEADNASRTGSDITTVYCNSSGACSPATSIDHLGTVTFTAGSPGRGAQSLRYQSTDLAGNVQSIVTKTININQLPTWGSVNSFDGNVTGTVSCLGSRAIRFDSNASDADAGQTLKFYVCSSDSATSAGCTETTLCSSTGSTSNPSCVYQQPDSNAAITVYGFIYDSLNESTGSSKSKSYTCDSAFPVVTLSQPANASSSSDNTPDFVAAPSETVSACYLQVQLFADDLFSLVDGYDGVDVGTDCDYTAPGDLADGVYYWRMYATDSQGITGGYSDYFNFTIDTTALSTSVVSVAGDTTAAYWDTVNDSQTSVVVEGETGMSCRFGASDAIYASMSSDNECSISGTQATCNLGALSQRANTLTHYISCKDSVGNQQSVGQNINLTFGVDWTAPVIGITAITSTNTANFAISPANIESSTVTENVAVDSTTCQYTLNGSTWTAGTWSGASSKCVDSGVTLNDGNNTINYRVSDQAGNQSTGSPIYRTKDNNAPTGLSLAATTIGATNIIWTVSGATDSAAGLHAEPYQFYYGSPAAYQSSTDYSLISLTPNTAYTVKARVRDALSNESSYTADVTRYTLANPPATPALSPNNATDINIAVGLNSNPNTTQVAVYEPSLQKWLNPTTRTLQTGFAWFNASAFENTQATGLDFNSPYCFQAIAKNGEDINTAVSALACSETGDSCLMPQNFCPFTNQCQLIDSEGIAVGGTCSDGLDNDCDGLTDSADPDCASNPYSCTLDATRACGKSTGACETGTQTCVSDGLGGTTWGDCSNDVEPTGESCDNVDNDCDGRIDGMSRTCGTPACGSQTCTAGTWSSCSYPPVEECLVRPSPFRVLAVMSYAKNSGNGSNDLNWWDKTPAEASYSVHRSTRGSFPVFSTIATLDENSTHYDDNSPALPDNQTYWYTVKVNSVGGSSKSVSDLNITADRTEPIIPGFVSVNESGSSLRLDWNNSSDESNLGLNHNSIIAYTRFTEATGTSAFNSAFTGTTGRLQNVSQSATSGWTRGLFRDDNAMRCDGVNDAVYFAGGFSSSNFTAQLWVYPIDLNGSKSDLMYSADAEATRFYVRTYPGNKVVFGVLGTGSPVFNTVISTNSLDVNKWNSVSAKLSGTSMTLYVNGVKTTGTVAGSAARGRSAALTLCGRGVGSDTVFRGDVDEFKFYNSALADADVNRHYLTPRITYQVDCTTGSLNGNNCATGADNTGLDQNVMDVNQLTIYNLTPTTNYCFRVRAVDYYGNDSNYSSTICKTTSISIPITVSNINNERWQPTNASFKLWCSVSNGAFGITSFGVPPANYSSGDGNYNFTPSWTFTIDKNVKLGSGLVRYTSAQSGTSPTTGQAYYIPSGSVGLVSSTLNADLNIYFQTGRLEKWKGYNFRAMNIFDYFGSRIQIRARTGDSITQSGSGDSTNFTLNSANAWTDWSTNFSQNLEDLNTSNAIQFQLLLQTTNATDFSYRPVLMGFDVLYTQPFSLPCTAVQCQIDQTAGTGVSYGPWNDCNGQIDINADGNYAVQYRGFYGTMVEPIKREYVLIQKTIPDIAADFCNNVQSSTSLNINWSQNSTTGPGIYQYQVFASPTSNFTNTYNAGTSYYGGSNTVAFTPGDFNVQSCGDRFCGPSEVCPADNLACPVGQICSNGCRAPGGTTCGDGTCSSGENCPLPSENAYCATQTGQSDYVCTNGCQQTSDSRLLLGNGRFDPYTGDDGIRFFRIVATDVLGITRTKEVGCRIDASSPFIIPKSEGRTISTSAGNQPIQLDIAAYSFTNSASDVNIVIDSNSDVNFPDGNFVGGSAIQINNEGGTLDFNTPVELRVDFNRTDLSCWPSDCSAAWADAHLHIYLYDENISSSTYHEWVPIPTDVNWDFNYMTADINHFSIYGPAEDEAGPTVTISNPTAAETTSADVTLAYSATDPSGISRYFVKIDSGNWITNGTNTTYPITSLADGTHTLHVIATDNSDNNSSDTTVTFTVSSGEPPDSGGSVCGNSIVETSEECDDGGRISGDGCSSSCQEETPTFSCSELGGTVCSTGQTCSTGSFIDSANSDLCCLGSCVGSLTVYSFPAFLKGEPYLSGLEQAPTSTNGYTFKLGSNIVGTVANPANDDRVQIVTGTNGQDFVIMNLTPNSPIQESTYDATAQNLERTLDGEINLLATRAQLEQGSQPIIVQPETQVVSATRPNVYEQLDSARYIFWNQEGPLQALIYSKIKNVRLQGYNLPGGGN